MQNYVSVFPHSSVLWEPLRGPLLCPGPHVWHHWPIVYWVYLGKCSTYFSLNECCQTKLWGIAKPAKRGVCMREGPTAPPNGVIEKRAWPWSEVQKRKKSHIRTQSEDSCSVWSCSGKTGEILRWTWTFLFTVTGLNQRWVWNRRLCHVLT